MLDIGGGRGECCQHLVPRYRVVVADTTKSPPADPRIEKVTLERSLVSWSAVVRTPISYNQLTNVVPGALAVYDLPDLAARLAPRRLTIRDTLDPAGVAVL